MSFIIVLNFVKFCSVISEMGICWCGTLICDNVIKHIFENDLMSVSSLYSHWVILGSCLCTIDMSHILRSVRWGRYLSFTRLDCKVTALYIIAGIELQNFVHSKLPVSAGRSGQIGVMSVNEMWRTGSEQVGCIQCLCTHTHVNIWHTCIMSVQSGELRAECI